jgi:hypothetical protein
LAKNFRRKKYQYRLSEAHISTKPSQLQMNHGLRGQVKDCKIRIDKVALGAKWLIAERGKTTQGFDPFKNAKLEICKLKDRLVIVQVHQFSKKK